MLLLNNGLILPDLNKLVPSDSILLEESIFSNFFDIILNLLRDNKRTDVCMFSSIYTSDYFIKIDYDSYKYEIPEILTGYLLGCRLQNIRYYILPLKIIYNKTNAHSNVIIVDIFNKTVEFFEPHGETYRNSNIYNTQKHVMNILTFLFQDMLFKIINTQENCPIGLQSRQNISNPKAGHCLAWSLLYITVRVLNITYPINSIIGYFDTFSNTLLDLYIRKFITFLEIETFFENEKINHVQNYPLIPFDDEEIKIRKTISILLNQYLNFKITDQERQQIFNDLISFRNYKDFNVLLFQAFHKHDIKRRRS
jgi:hypothetical protein